MSQPKPLQKIIDSLLKNLGIETKIKESMAVVLWPEVVGERVAEVSRAVRVIDGILFIKVDNSAWRAELMMHRDTILKKINKKLGKFIVHEIRFT